MLNIIRTAIDTEPSSLFISQMIEFNKNNPNKGIILIVPDSLSHTGERLMAQTFGGSGLNGHETMTFHQMIRKFLIHSSLRLSDTGKRMLLFRAANSVEITDGNFASLVKKQGFLDCLSELISEFKRYGVSGEQLRNICNSTTNTLLKSKLNVISDIYEKYYLIFEEENFCDSDTDLEKVAPIILENEFFKDKAVWIAGFDEFLPLTLKVIISILKTCDDVTITIPEDTHSDSDLFKRSEYSVTSLIHICKDNGIGFEYTSNLLHAKKSKELEFLIDNYEEAESSYDLTPQNIHVYESTDIYNEVDTAAIKIADLTLEHGYRYGDIGIVVSEPDTYIPFIEAVFGEYKIPYFSDYAIPVSEHPVSMIITCAADLIKEKRSTASVLRFLRTGLLNDFECDGIILTEYDIDKIENHALKLGIRGNMWDNEKYWLNTNKGVFDDIVKNCDDRVCEPLEILHKISPIMQRINTFCKKAGKKASVKTLCTYLFEFFDELKIYERISKKSAELMLTNPNESLRFQQVWNLITELADQAVTVLGNEVLTFGELYQYFKSGLSRSNLDIIPAGIDRITVGSTDSFAPDKLKVLFILGTNSGKLPVLASNEGLLSDADRHILNDMGTELAPYGIDRNNLNEFKLLKLFAMPTEHLFVSYALCDSSGNKMLPSIIISTFEKLFPGICIEKQKTSDTILISTPEVTIKKLLLNNDENDPIRQKVYNWYKSHPDEWQQKLSLLDTVSAFNNYTPAIEPQTAAELYKKYTAYSVSRLENFYVCPFRYFLENGLKAKEREEKKVKKSDLGTLLHWAVQQYCTEVDNGGSPSERKNNWLMLSDEKSKAIADSVCQKMKNTLSSQDTSKRMDNILFKVKELLVRCIPVINMSFKNSKYIPYGYEWSFDNLVISDGEHSVTLHGIIDRLDIYENPDDNKAYIRVIDYKSGTKKFSSSGIYNNLDLQLGVYAIAAEDAYKKGIPETNSMTPFVNGVFYEKLTDEFEKSTFEDIQNSTGASCEILDGMMFIKSELQKNKEVFPSAGLIDIDSTLSENEKSEYLKITLNKAKTLVDKRYSSVTNEENMDILKKWIKKSVIEADRSIKSGMIDIMPYKKSNTDTGCTKYCPYKDVCTFDRSKDNSFRILKSERDGFKGMREELEKE